MVDCESTNIRKSYPVAITSDDLGTTRHMYSLEDTGKCNLSNQRKRVHDTPKVSLKKKKLATLQAMGIPETAKTPFQQDGSKKNAGTAKIKNNIRPVSRVNFRDFSLIPVP